LGWAAPLDTAGVRTVPAFPALRAGFDFAAAPIFRVTIFAVAFGIFAGICMYYLFSSVCSLFSLTNPEWFQIA
jgi:hypothetical protein